MAETGESQDLLVSCFCRDLIVHSNDFLCVLYGSSEAGGKDFGGFSLEPLF